MQDSAVDTQIHGSGSAVFLWVKPEHSKDILNPLGLSVTKTRTGIFSMKWFSLTSDYC